ncbi:MAG TPA: hypothetical protein VNA69_20700 [Thermoanaerobaculia bacterium]|nr:hypothetical protein [Thermoanaerobaculia bacterium]
MRTRSLAKWLFLPLLFIASAAIAQSSIPIELEVGYRFADIKGNESLYRTQINEREGFVLRSFTFFTSGLGPSDEFRVDATDLGTSPTSSLRVMSARNGAYRLRLGYRSFDSFNATPAFAQHAFDRKRTMFDADLELLTFSRFTPFVGYSWSRNRGPGAMTYVLGADEFALRSDLDESDREIRVGSAFTLGKFSGQVTQGWRSLKSDERFALFEGAGAGNNAGAILGRPISADAIDRVSRTDVDAPFTNLYVMGDILPRVRVIGDYVRFSAESTGFENESSSGSFVSFGIGRFFNGLSEITASRAENNTWRGGVRAEVVITDTITFQAGYRSEHRELEGAGLINSLYRDTLTFGGLDPRSVEEVLQSTSVLNRDEDILSATVSARSVGPFSFRAGYSVANQDLEIAPDLSEIVVPGNQDGTFSRSVRTVDASATFTKRLFSIGASWRIDDADDPVMRTDFLERDRLRVRATFRTPGNAFRIGLTAEEGNQSNDRDGVNFDAGNRQLITDFEIAPVAAVRFHGSYAQFRADSVVTVRRPETFVLVPSTYTEEGESYEGGIGLVLTKVNVDASVARFDNEGSFPFTVNRYRVRAGYDFTEKMGIVGELAKDQYDETSAFGDFDARRFGLYLRLRR